ncbi:MAG: hypothetical protein ACXVRD_06285 [Gaiellaceae bacterium]
MKRSGPLRDRVALRALRLSAVAWAAAERLGLDAVGSSEGPPLPDPAHRAALDELVVPGATIDARDCPFPVHELLTHLVLERGLLLHGSNDASLAWLKPRPARDFRTELRAVVATDDGVWPLFYAVIDRERVESVFTACVHAGRRRVYLFATSGEPAWTRGAVYAVPREGFRREWGREWVAARPVEPVLRVLVGPEDFPLREDVLAVDEFSGLGKRFREAKRARAA